MSSNGRNVASSRPRCVPLNCSVHAEEAKEEAEEETEEQEEAGGDEEEEEEPEDVSLTMALLTAFALVWRC